MVSVYNVFRKEDAQIRDSELKKLGFQEELAGSLTYPIMTVNGNIYFGTDSIRSSIREAYLTAGEDLFVYGRGVYDPTKNETLKQQLEDYKLEKGSSSVVYFYRTVCEECIRTSGEVLDLFPETVVVDGVSYPQQIIRINTRSGRNTEILQAFLKCMRCLWRIRWFRLCLPPGDIWQAMKRFLPGCIRKWNKGPGLG